MTDTTTTEYTEAEEAFIDAFVPVVHAGAKVQEAEEAMIEAEEASAEAGQALGLTGDRDGVARLNTLMLAAAGRAGYDEDSEIVQALHFSREAIEAEFALREALDDLVLDEAASANPVI